MVNARELAQIGLGEKDPEDILSEVHAEKRRRFMNYEAYGPQLRFHNSTGLERIMSGANQSGKTFAGVMEAGIHLTGFYPSWWEGHRLKPRLNPISEEYELNVWILGTDNRTVRDSMMSKLIGTDNDAGGAFTKGVIDPSLIDHGSRKMTNGTTGMVDNIKVEHVSGIKSRVFFRSYEQGRNNLQSQTIDIVYCDEEPPEGLMGELKARLTATGGLMYMAFTPLNGMTPLVQSFWNSDDPDMFLVCMSIYEAGHMTPDKLRAMEKRYASLKESERKARMYGIPSVGAGMVYPIEDKDIMGAPPENIPSHWRFLNALDFGRGEHPTAIVFGVLDPSTDIAYIYDCEKVTHNSVEENALLIRKRGSWIPTAYPHDLLKNTGVSPGGKMGSKTSEGRRYRDWYENAGVVMTHEFARTEEKSGKVEVGLIDVRRRMMEGRLKIHPKLRKWWDEKQTYRYGEDDKPIKKFDDLMDATRYFCIMLRYAVSIFDSITTTNNEEVSDDTDIFD